MSRTPRANSYRWFLWRLFSIWNPRGIFDYQSRRFKLVHWHKNILRGYIRETRELLDQLEAKLDA